MATITQIIDGDTFVCRNNGRTFSSRARWIDAPATKLFSSSTDPRDLNQWMWGNAAKQWLISKLKGQTVIVVEHAPDAYGRTLCDWYLNTIALENSIQIQMVAAGIAANSLPYQQYDFPNTDLDLYIEILKAGASAKAAQRGFWADPAFMLPYLWKKPRK
jgi:endonuclease YncB( thermonuclease family)